MQKISRAEEAVKRPHISVVAPQQRFTVLIMKGYHYDVCFGAEPQSTAPGGTASFTGSG
ncbi:MAG: hypothetical protein R2942_02545 [Ignavibacteria bacterium]